MRRPHECGGLDDAAEGELVSSLPVAPYPQYRPSGEEWLEQLPEHWANSTLGFECSVKARLGWKGLKAEEYVESGYIFLETPNIKGN